MSYVVGVDVWEGSLDIQEDVLKQAGVSFIIIRMNDINGYHHLDGNFARQWEEAAPFIRFPYFVYSPWYSGRANFDWLVAHLPKCVRRVAVDVEVIKAGYAPLEYAANLKGFVNLCKGAGLKPVIYTGPWFIPILSEWPTDTEYWWARYPTYLYPEQSEVITWQALITRVNMVSWLPGQTPGPCKLWQCSADRYKPDGCAGRAIDINIWNGTLSELAAWVGEQGQPPVAPDAVRVKASVLNIRSAPDANASNVVATTTLGKVLAVESQCTDNLGRAWYQVGRGMFLAGWLVEVV